MQGQPELAFNVLEADGIQRWSRPARAHPDHPRAVHQGLDTGQKSHPHAATEPVALHGATGLAGGGYKE